MSEERSGPVEFSANVKMYGRDEPLPRRHELRAGPLSAVLEGGDLRYVKLGDDTVVLRLYAAIRDRNWNTIEPRFLRYELDRGDEGFTLQFAAENVGDDVDFEWQGSIVGTPDGVIAATLDGVARRNFLRNRIGWCVLHPMELAGVTATTETPDGRVEGQFPNLISPHQPFFDMQSIQHETPGGGEVVIRFAGDLWEMEDQRNWTDASYKTYSTPLRIPYPVELKEGDRVWQQVTIEGKGGPPPSPKSGEPVRVTVDRSRSRPVPPIGLGVASHGAPLSDEDIALLRAVKPAHLLLPLDLTQPGWQERLAQATTEAGALDAALAIEAVAGTDGAGLHELAAALSRSNVEIAKVLVFSTGEMVTGESVLAGTREAFGAAGLSVPIGGGTRAYFTELNRATLPLDAMEAVSYTINPQVHAFDNTSLTETLAAQPETVRSARAIVGDRSLVVGPITLRPPFNPNATGTEPQPAPGELPATVDARQPTLFAAGWLAGSVNALGNAGADALTYFETTGWRGVIERRDHPLRVSKFHSWPGMVFPVYHVLADIAEFRDGEILQVDLGDGLRVQALALRDGDELRVLLANMTDATVEVSLEVPGARGSTMRQLDDHSFTRAASQPEDFRASSQPLGVAVGVD
ncbi:MAG: hypothetical protein ACRDJC_11260, partial [Thermomicrobiales bacterium]